MADNELDELIQGNSAGELQTASVDLVDAVNELEDALDVLGVDLRTSMPEDEDSLERQAREARSLLVNVTEKVSDEAGEGYGL